MQKSCLHVIEWDDERIRLQSKWSSHVIHFYLNQNDNSLIIITYIGIGWGNTEGAKKYLCFMMFQNQCVLSLEKNKLYFGHLILMLLKKPTAMYFL